MRGRAVMPPFRGVESPLSRMPLSSPACPRRHASAGSRDRRRGAAAARRAGGDRAGASGSDPEARGHRLPHGSVVVQGRRAGSWLSLPGSALHEPDAETLRKGPKVAPRSGRTERRRRRPRASPAGRRSTCPSSCERSSTGSSTWRSESTRPGAGCSRWWGDHRRRGRRAARGQEHALERPRARLQPPDPVDRRALGRHRRAGLGVGAGVRGGRPMASGPRPGAHRGRERRRPAAQARRAGLHRRSG